MAKSSNIEESIDLPKLKNESIFSNWKYRILVLLEKKGVLDVLKQNGNETEKFNEMDCEARYWIIQSIDDELLNIVKNCQTAQEMIKKLEVQFQRKAVSSKFELKKQLLTMKLETSGNLHIHFEKFDHLISELDTIGCELDESDKICHLLLTLPEEYKVVMTSLEDVVLSLSSENMLEFVKCRLLDTEIKLLQKKANCSNNDNLNTPLKNETDGEQLDSDAFGYNIHLEPTESIQFLQCESSLQTDSPEHVDGDLFRTDSPVSIRFESEELEELLNCEVVLQDAAHELWCDICDHWCLSTAALQNHKQTHSQNVHPTTEKILHCGICQKKFNSETTLIKHLNTHERKCNDSANIVNHNKDMKIPFTPEQFKCDVCEKRFTEQSDLAYHFRVMHKLQVLREIEVCQYFSRLDETNNKDQPDPGVRKQTLKNARFQLVSVSTPESRPVTSKHTSTDAEFNYNIHSNNFLQVRPDSSGSVCVVDSEPVNSLSPPLPESYAMVELEKLPTATMNTASCSVELTDNVVISQDPDKTMCEICNHCFPTITQLRSHMRKGHFAVRSQTSNGVPCDICHEGFSSKDTLIEHHKSHQMKRNESANNVNHNKVVKIPFTLQQFKCDVCEKRFTEQCDLAYHFRVVHNLQVLREVEVCQYSSRFDETNNNDQPNPGVTKHTLKQARLQLVSISTPESRPVTSYPATTVAESIPNEHSHEKFCSDELTPNLEHVTNLESSNNNIRSDFDFVEVRPDSNISMCVIDSELVTSLSPPTPESNVMVEPEELPEPTMNISSCGVGLTDEVVMLQDQDMTLLCEICNHCCASRTELRVHMKEAHPAVRNFFQCDFCYKGFITKDTLMEHLKLHQKMNPQFIVLGKPLDTQINKSDNDSIIKACSFEELRNVDDAQGTQIILTECCSSNNQSAPGLNTVLGHVTSCQKNCMCDICNKRFAHKSDLNKQTEKQYTLHYKKPHVCQYCGKEFKSMAHMLRHKVTHTKERNYWCDNCNFKFTLKSSLKHHLRMHQERVDQRHSKTPQTSRICEYCGKTFNHMKDMLRHRVSHTGEKNYWCDICGKKFTLRSSIKLHIRRVHEGEKKCQCDMCGKRFQTNTFLRQHINIIHNKMKPFKCEECGQKFGAKGTLSNHIKTHSDDRHFNCDVCNKAFKRKSCVIRHTQAVHKLNNIAISM